MDVDRAVWRVLVASGAVFLATGVVMVASPGIAAALPFGRGVITVIGVAAALIGLVAGRSRLRGEITEFRTPDPERPADNPAPGDDVDRMLFEMTRLRQGIDENRGNLEEQLRWVAIATLRERQDCSEAEAVRRLETGEWTDNEVAADFFREIEERQEDDLSVDAFLTGDRSVEEWRDRFAETVEALIEIAGLDLPATEHDRTSDSGSFLGSLLGGGEEDDAGVPGVGSNRNVADSSAESYDTDEPFEDLSVHRTNRWLGVTGFGLLSLGVGTFIASPGLMLVGAVGVVYTMYARLEAIPQLEALEVERELSETDPQPGEEIQVTVTIRNAGGAMLPDLAFVDVVPDEFVVTHGTPRLYTGLRPGASASFQYTVMVERGDHGWPLLTLGRDFSGVVERASLITPDAPLVCTMPLQGRRETPVRAQTIQYSGDVSTSEGGPGLEFHSVREYQEGDPMNRIDWKRLARTGEFSTINFRQEKAAKITLLFDTRQSAYVSHARGEPHAVDLSVYAASDVFDALYDAGNLVGVAAYDTVPCWLSPGAGDEHLERARQLFTRHPALSSVPPDEQHEEDGHVIQGRYIDPMTHVRRRLPENSQIFMFSPLVDDYSGEVALRLDSVGHLVTVLSPDVTGADTVGQRLTALERTMRIRALRERGIRVVDWEPAERLGVELERAQTRWTA